MHNVKWKFIYNSRYESPESVERNTKLLKSSLIWLTINKHILYYNMTSVNCYLYRISRWKRHKQTNFDISPQVWHFGSTNLLKSPYIQIIDAQILHWILYHLCFYKRRLAYCEFPQISCNKRFYSMS